MGRPRTPAGRGGHHFSLPHTPGQLVPRKAGPWAQPDLADMPLPDSALDAPNKAGQVFRGRVKEGPALHVGYGQPSAELRFLGPTNPKSQQTLSRPGASQLSEESRGPMEMPVG